MGKFRSRSKDGARSYPPLPINRTLKLHLRVPSIPKLFYERADARPATEPPRIRKLYERRDFEACEAEKTGAYFGT